MRSNKTGGQGTVAAYAGTWDMVQGAATTNMQGSMQGSMQQR